MVNEFDKENNTTQNLLKQGLLLTLSMFLVRLIGVFYRIPLTNLWGDAGLGTYSDAYTIYSLFLMISSVSVPTMMSKLISEKVAIGKYHDVKKITKCCLICFSLLGLSGCLIMIIGAPFLANAVFKNPDLVVPIRGLAPTVYIVSVLSVYRGFFLGLNNMKPHSTSQIVESLVHALFSIMLAYILIKKSLVASLLGGIISTGIAAVASFLFLYGCYRYYNKNTKMGKAKATLSQEPSEKIYRAIFAMLLPIVLSNIIYNIKSIIDSSIFGNLMSWKGFDLESIKAMKGLYSGKFCVFLAVPIAIGDSVATAVVPSIAADYSTNNILSVRRKAKEVTKTILMITMPASFGLMILGKPIVKAFFPGAPLGGELFWFGSLAVAFYSVSDITTSILQGAGYQDKPMWNSLWATLLSIVLSVLLILCNVGVYTLPVSMLFFSCLRMYFNLMSLERYCHIRIPIKKIALKPVLGSLAMCLVSVLTYVLSFAIFGSNWLSLISSIIVSVVAYFFIMVNLGWLGENEMKQIPYGQYLHYLKVKK